MSTSAIILKSENGEITYVVGEVVTKTKAQLEADIAELTKKAADLHNVDVEALKNNYELELQALKDKYTKLINDAEAENVRNKETLDKYYNEIDNLQAVLSTLPDAEISTEEVKD